MKSAASSELKKQEQFRRSQMAVSFFPVEAWPQFAPWAPAQAYPIGTELFRQGDPAKAVYLIEKGLVKLLCLEEGGQMVILGLRGPGWLLGAPAAILQRPYVVTVETVTRCHLYRIPAEGFRQLVRTDLNVAWQLCQMSSWEWYDRVTHYAGLVCLPARQRLENLLWELIGILTPAEPPQPVRLQMPLKRWEIASMISVSPPYLSQLLNSLEQEGKIQRSKGWLIIPDPQAVWHWPEY
jgi:CRP-like cAMP-binding protein